ncbi:MAG: SDR family NAD(P)-dependent oxidoreductase, partial [Clostridia bacterium]
MLLQDKVAIITGGGSGMGKAMCQLFSRQGAKVVIADLNKEAAEATRLELAGEAIAVQVNVADEAMVSALVEETIHSYGRVDILVNNAGVPMSFLPIEELTV